MRTTRTAIPEELKKKVVQEYLSTDVTQRELYERYQLRGKNINAWILKFGKKSRSENPVDPKSMKKKRKSDAPESGQSSNHTPIDELERLKQENAALQAALDYERLRSEALDTMINLAEEHFHIPIRKKSGAKQSKQ